MWGIGSWLGIYPALPTKTLYAFCAPLCHEDENILLKCNFTRNYFACSLNEVTGRCLGSEFNPLDARHRRHHLHLTAGLSRVTDFCVLSMSADTEGVDVSVCCEKVGGAVKVIMYFGVLKRK